MATPKLSIVIPTYNRREYLAQCLDSLREVRVDCEIVISDNASTDGTAEMVAQRAQIDSRIRYVRNEHNLGLAANNNRALREARGEYLCLLGDDDLSLPGNFEKKTAILDAYPHIGLVYSLWYRIDAQGRNEGVVSWPGLLNYSYLGGRNEFEAALIACHIGFSSYVFRRTLYEQYGGLDETPENVARDWDMLLRFLRHTQTAFIAEPLVAIRVHPQSETEANARRHRLFAPSRIALWRKWLVEPEDPPVLDERIWQLMAQAFLPDLQYEFGNDQEKIEDYLQEFLKLKQQNHQKIAARFQLLTQAFLPKPTPVPPDWWLRLWQQLQRQAGGQLLCLGLPTTQRLEIGGGWKVARAPESLGEGLADSLVAFYPDIEAEGQQEEIELASAHLREGGLFLLGKHRFPTEAENWRANLEEVFQATVHLVDPETECEWLFAFGWKGERLSSLRRRVLMTTHQQALKVFGGAETQIFETLIALRDQGVRADLSLALRLPVEPYELLHLFNLSYQDKAEQFRRIQTPWVVSTIFSDCAEMFFNSLVARAIFALSDEASVERALQAWREGSLQITGLSREQFIPSAEVRRAQQMILEGARGLLVLSERESQQLRSHFPSLRTPLHFVPNGVRPERFLEATPEAFVSQFGLKDFVLCVGRIEPAKNQALLVWALRGTGLPLVLAGREVDPEYAGMCRRWGGTQVHLVGELPPDLLASAYAAARVHALPSWGEVAGLASLEAGLAGCALVVTEHGGEKEYLGEYAFVCDPGNWRSIREAVIQAWEDTDRQEARRRHILQHYNWARAAQLTAEAYEAALAIPDREGAVRGFPDPETGSPATHNVPPKRMIIPLWNDPASWQPVVEQYLRSYSSKDGTLLQLYAGPLNGTMPETAYKLVKEFLLTLGVDPEECPDIEIVSGAA